MNKRRNNNQKQNNIPKQNRTYRKTFGTFVDGVLEMAEMSDVVNKFVDDYFYDETTESVATDAITPEDFNYALLDYMASHRVPSIHDKNTRFWSINVAANKLYIKTGFKISFGWQFKYRYDKDTKEYVVDEYEFTLSDISENNNIMDFAESHNWDLEVK